MISYLFQDIQCPTAHCNKMKNVLIHMSSCKIGEGCEVPHCSTSRTIINHWNGCINVECPICQRLKRLPDCNQTEIFLASPKVCTLTYLVYSFIYFSLNSRHV